MADQNQSKAPEMFAAEQPLPQHERRPNRLTTEDDKLVKRLLHQVQALGFRHCRNEITPAELEYALKEAFVEFLRKPGSERILQKVTERVTDVCALISVGFDRMPLKVARASAAAVQSLRDAAKKG